MSLCLVGIANAFLVDICQAFVGFDEIWVLAHADPQGFDGARDAPDAVQGDPEQVVSARVVELQADRV